MRCNWQKLTTSGPSNDGGSRKILPSTAFVATGNARVASAHARGNATEAWQREFEGAGRWDLESGGCNTRDVLAVAASGCCILRSSATLSLSPCGRDEVWVRIMAMDAVAGVSMATGRIIKAFASPGTTSSRTCTSTVKVSARGRLNSHCEGVVSRFCNNQLGGRVPTKRGFLVCDGQTLRGKLPVLSIRASHGENVLPLPMENGVATLESLLGASPACSPPKREDRRESLEALIERMIFNCRFLTLMAVVGSLAGSVLCFFKGSLFVTQSFVEYFQASWQGLGTSQVVFLLVEAVDVYLMGTVMLIFGMGLYELFVSALEVGGDGCEEVQNPVCGSNLFGLFRMRERPKWLEIRSLDELKTKLGHVIVMILLVGMFEKSKKVPINSGLDLLCFSASILLSSGCLYLLSKLHSSSPDH